MGPSPASIALYSSLKADRMKIAVDVNGDSWKSPEESSSKTVYFLAK
jgi:hypothetical protein